MYHTEIETKLFSDTDDCYAKYFFHHDGKLWHCLVHLHLGDNNDITYHASEANKKKARKVARQYVELRTRSLRKKMEKSLSKTIYIGDSLPYPKITKEQLDMEMDEYNKIPSIELPPPVIQNSSSKETRFFQIACTPGH